jgi:hypothetical protein
MGMHIQMGWLFNEAMSKNDTEVDLLLDVGGLNNWQQRPVPALVEINRTCRCSQRRAFSLRTEVLQEMKCRK